VALPLTKFVKRGVIPVLFDELGARRLQADLHSRHVFVHRWVEALGARKEGEMRELAPEATYFRYALCRADWVDKSDNSCYPDNDGRTPRRSSLSPASETTSECHVRPEAPAR
jgi:hypothetical protein